MLVPLPRAASRDLISFFTFHISTFLSAASTVVSAILNQIEDLLKKIYARFINEVLWAVFYFVGGFSTSALLQTLNWPYEKV